MRHLTFCVCACALVAGCAADPAALGTAVPGDGPQVVFDVFHLPFPDLPLPNDFATRYDATSPTGRRLNASIAAGTTAWERGTRAELDKLSGWGTLAPITVAFDAPLDVEVIYDRHHQDPPDFADDAVLVVDVTPGSPGLCEAVPLDLGQGNYPLALPDTYEFPADPRAGNGQIVFEEVEEDGNHNGVLDPGEDTDMDGVLDHPNTRDGTVGGEVMDFYERETNTLIMKPMMPMREATTYAVVLTRRLVGVDGKPVRSPFAGINATAQTADLAALPGCLGRYQLGLADVAFTWSFTTQSLTADYQQVRDGLYGLGPLAHLAADFPATVSKLYTVAPTNVVGATPTVVTGAQLLPLLTTVEGGNGAASQSFVDNFSFVDFTVVGELPSPQFYPRTDADGGMLPLYRQVWDLAQPPRAEAVPFWLFVPKHRSGPAPVLVFIHGHGGSKFSGLDVAGALARYGVATLAIDGPGHGIGLSAQDLATYTAVFNSFHLTPLFTALLDSNRAIDWNGDGVLDPGADFWTSYVFHTRDQVRQTMVDVMQLVRMLHGFDGRTRWAFDPAGTGAPGLAGDFDGDGQVDIGGSAAIQIAGGSLGGITDALAAGVEPALDSAISIVPGGMLSEIGGRSALGGVKTAMVLRMLGPLFYSEGGATPILKVAVNDAEGNEARLALHELPALAPADTVVLFNLDNGEVRCGAVSASGAFRVSVPADKGDRLELRAYAGPLPPRARIGCVVPTTAAKLTITTIDRDVDVGAAHFAAGSSLLAIADGFGLRRSTPELRRMVGLGQIAMDSADPMNFAPYWEGHRTLTYGTGETVATNVWLIPSNGDPGVCIANGIALARAAGFIPYDVVDPAYGKSQNQVMLDTFTTEGVSRLARYRDRSDRPVLMDVSNLPAITGADDGFDAPRLTPPLRSTATRPDGGASGALIVMLDPRGKHGFVTPDPDQPFDLGTLMMHMIGRYASTSGKQLSYDACQVTASCPWIAPVVR